MSAEARITFKKGRVIGEWIVYADGAERGSVWRGYNIMLRTYWTHSGANHRNPMTAWPTRRDAAHALIGLDAKTKVPA